MWRRRCNRLHGHDGGGCGRRPDATNSTVMTEMFDAGSASNSTVTPASGPGSRHVAANSSCVGECARAASACLHRLRLNCCGVSRFPPARERRLCVGHMTTLQLHRHPDSGRGLRQFRRAQRWQGNAAACRACIMNIANRSPVATCVGTGLRRHDGCMLDAPIVPIVTGLMAADANSATHAHANAAQIRQALRS